MTAPAVHRTREVHIKITAEALSSLVAEALDLPADVKIVGMLTPPLEPTTILLQLEGSRSLEHLNPGVESVWIEFHRGVEGRTSKNRKLLRIVDANDLTRGQASVELPPATVIVDAEGKPIAERLTIARPAQDS